MRYVVEIESHAGKYHGNLHQGDPANARRLTDLQLGPDATVTIKGTSYRLGKLIEALIRYNKDDLDLVYDERGQVELGRYLYTQIFGGIDPSERRRLRNATVEVQILTHDEHIGRLPWVLLFDSTFLSTAGWSITLAHRQAENVCELPPSPKMLVVAPQPVGVPETKGAAHLEKLEELLSSADPRHALGRNLRVVQTWEEFTQSVPDFQPHIVYYYGHGIGDPHTSRLVFATGKNHDRLDKPIADVALCLRHMADGPPLVVYLNCCQGDAGGLLGAGRQLGDCIPAVITNRTVAHITAAQAQGLAFWRRVLLDGVPPHRTVAEMYTDLVSHDFTLQDARWMTPVVHRHYVTWKSNPPKPRSPLERDPHWRFKLDRVRQFSQVFYLTSQMLQERKPRSLVYAWYGQAGQGVDRFHQRLTLELREKLPRVYLYEVRPDWPLELFNPYRSFEDMLTEAFEVPTLDAIPSRIRTKNRGVVGSPTLVYVRHIPVQSSGVINPRALKKYLEWWDEHFVSLLEGQVFALLGISFVVGRPDAFYRTLTERERINELPLSDKTVFCLLDEMERIVKKDLLDFLRTHNIPLSSKHRDRILDEILARTQGHYDMTLEALKDIADRPWDLEGDTSDTQRTGDYDYD